MEQDAGHEPQQYGGAAHQPGESNHVTAPHIPASRTVICPGLPGYALYPSAQVAVWELAAARIAWKPRRECTHTPAFIENSAGMCN